METADGCLLLRRRRLPAEAARMATAEGLGAMASSRCKGVQGARVPQGSVEGKTKRGEGFNGGGSARRRAGTGGDGRDRAGQGAGRAAAGRVARRMTASPSSPSQGGCFHKMEKAIAQAKLF